VDREPEPPQPDSPWAITRNALPAHRKEIGEPPSDLTCIAITSRPDPNEWKSVIGGAAPRHLGEVRPARGPYQKPSVPAHGSREGERRDPRVRDVKVTVPVALVVPATAPLCSSSSYVPRGPGRSG